MRPVTFALIVDDFGMKVVGNKQGKHLIDTIKRYYPVVVDEKGEIFAGIHLKWNYDVSLPHVNLSMPGYIAKTLTKFQHPDPMKPQHAPHKHTPIDYGAKVQHAVTDDSPPLLHQQIKRVMNVMGMLLYYAHAVDPTLATALSTIAADQAKGTKATRAACNQLLDYVVTHPNATLRYIASDMMLAVHSDASYLLEKGARSRVGGHFYLNVNDEACKNGAILTLSTIIKHVMATASEAELAALFYNLREAIPLRAALEEMGHRQPRD